MMKGFLSALVLALFLSIGGCVAYSPYYDPYVYTAPYSYRPYSYYPYRYRYYTPYTPLWNWYAPSFSFGYYPYRYYPAHRHWHHRYRH